MPVQVRRSGCQYREGFRRKRARLRLLSSTSVFRCTSIPRVRVLAICGIGFRVREGICSRTSTMVQLPNIDKLRSESKQHVVTAAPSTVVVKEEVEDALDEMYGPKNKRSKASDPAVQLDGKMVMPPSTQYDPLDEPSPLGLRLKKSPSLLDMIQMRLSQQNSISTSSVTCTGFDIGKKKELKSTAVSGVTDKMKASNFPASILRIGNWEYFSRYEGDLVAKCYYAKHKLVWEVLDGGLKNKIEIQWSDITALKASCPENGPATLDIVLARRPLFFRETNPQPRKHTLWQATSDFTGGKASIHRRHFLQCHQGLLNKHFEKLIQCDQRLKTLSQQPEITMETSCFDPSPLEELDESKCIRIDNLKDNHGCSGLHDPKIFYAKTLDTVDAVQDLSARQMGSHDSGGLSDDDYSDNRSTSKPSLHWEQVQAPRLKASMSKDDLVSHLEHCISEQLASGNPLFSADCLPNKEKLEELANHLLTDSSQGFVSDEKSLLSKVNSFCCLLQKETSSLANLQSCVNAAATRTEDHQEFLYEDPLQSSQDRKALGMSRKDSFGELLMNLPRIASFPKFLISITEDSDDQ